jgi:CheY-like chemotaxis protein/nitrogen-specific signal transduction histidine kinase
MDADDVRVELDSSVRTERVRELEALKEAVRARDRALAVVAHDLRNPLGVIVQSAEFVLQDLEEPKARRHVERICRVAQRASELVATLLDVAAFEEGRFSIERRSMDLSKLILAVMESEQALAARNSIITSIDLSPEVSRVEADAGRIRAVLENLFGNALKFTSSGSTITVGASIERGEALVWVKDTGSGISEDDLPHLFDRFWLAQKAGRRGTGLGLGICKAIVEAHGGRIWVESALGRGTTVFFTLPVSPSTVPAAQNEPVSILLVDDKPENLMALQAILERPDYRFLLARSGADALRIALNESFDLALIDVVMPDMNGLEVATHMKTLERCRDVPIIFITALGNDPKVIHRAYDAGAADYLVKPLDPDIVRKKVAVFVNLSRR